jgi:class 3 adenylate cyclase
VSTRTVDDALGAAREALARHAWQEAFELFSEADRQGDLSPKDLELLGEAAWWAGQPEAMLDVRERAYAAYQAQGNAARAGLMATRLAFDHSHALHESLGKAWFNRAKALLDGQPAAPERAWLLRMEAVQAHEGRGDSEAALDFVREALDIATAAGDTDLQAMLLLDQGRILVATGHLEEGQALMDEAMVAAVGGDVGAFATGIIYCNMIGSCQQIADYRRAGEWTEAAARWCERQAINGFPGVCRVHRAEIMRLRGAWADAEVEARQACEELSKHGLLDQAGEAFYEIGEIRMRMGDLREAEEAFRQAHELGREPSPGLESLRVIQGKPEAAAASLRRAVAEEGDRLRRARLRAPQVEIALALGDLATAQEAVEDLEATAEVYGTQALHAAASDARGRFLLGEGAPEAAMERLRRSLRQWKEADAPYEAARARVLIAAAAKALGDDDTATLELRVARSAFEKLGAALDARHVDELMRRGAGGALRRVDRTFMFTDIVRSTNLVEAIGDEAWEDVIRWHDQALRAAFGRHGGQEVDHSGDGFFVAFEDASAAVECAVEIQRSLAEHRRTAGFAPQVRIGLHAAEATERVGDFGGRGVHQAARIGALAEGGDILATEETAAAVEGRYEASEPREVVLKGISGPVRVVSLSWR